MSRKKTGDLAEEHAIGEAADFVDDKTGRTHTDKIETGAAKAKDLIEGLGDDV